MSISTALWCGVQRPRRDERFVYNKSQYNRHISLFRRFNAVEITQRHIPRGFHEDGVFRYTFRVPILVLLE
jgi:hypothetical protein